MLVHVKVKRKRADPPQPCMFRGSCIGACEWCETHDYSEACVPMLQNEVLSKGTTLDNAIALIEKLERRLQHLCSSKLIASFDKLDYRSKEYSRDIDEADRMYLGAYNVLLKATSCNTCAQRDFCGYAPEWGESVRYNCPHYRKE